MSVEDMSDDEPERKVEAHTDHPKMTQSLPPSPPTAIELFSGSKHLTSALHMCGINAVGFDIIDDTEFDILNPAFYTCVEHYMRICPLRTSMPHILTSSVSTCKEP